MPKAGHDARRVTDRRSTGITVSKPESATRGIWDHPRLGPICREAMQIDDPALSRKAIAEIRSMISSADLGTVREGLKAFCEISSLDFDKAAFRPVIEPHLAASDRELRYGAWEALLKCGVTGEEKERLREMIRTDGMNDDTLTFLFTLSEDDLTGPEGEICEKWLSQAQDKEAMEDLFYSMEGAQIDGSLEARLISLSRQPLFEKLAIDVIGRIPSKSDSVVARLVESLDSSDDDLAFAPGGGLESGLSESQEKLVATAAARLLKSRPRAKWANRYSWEFLEAHAGEEQLADLQEIREKPAISNYVRRRVDSIIERISPDKTPPEQDDEP